MSSSTVAVTPHALVAAPHTMSTHAAATNPGPAAAPAARARRAPTN
eukprot:CAMPEP_0197593160 /NCGR_PEP_ID=MMETSP1326-20131121/17402_1 /TAXON_ID=1155430 /ORGANISM="Genus nov. species nov., Strain RCC2288" /LENGTH=45 /DNA_ID= /DNA_START= /DNA_END= /DNA_ORIENTATION=